MIARGDLGALALLALGAAAAWLWLPGDLAFLTRAAAGALLVLSLWLVTGLGGVASLGQAALFGAGAYGAGLACAGGFVTDPVALLGLGLACGALAGLVMGALAARHGGLAQLVVTIALGQLAHALANAATITGGSDGLPGIAPGPVLGLFAFDLPGRTGFALAFAALSLTYAALARFARSPFALLCRAIAADPVRVEALGARPYPALVKLHVLAGGVAGLGGALAAITAGVVGLDSLAFTRSAEALVMLALGGAGGLGGAVLGAFAFQAAEHLAAAANPSRWLLAVGGLLILVVLALPGGLASLGGVLRRRGARDPSPRADLRKTPPAQAAEASPYGTVPPHGSPSARSPSPGRFAADLSPPGRGEGAPFSTSPRRGEVENGAGEGERAKRAVGRHEIAPRGAAGVDFAEVSSEKAVEAPHPPALRVENLTRRFGGLLILDGVSLSLAPGERVALIGPNGAGKTTLVNALTGTLRPDAGTIHLGGEDVTRCGPVDRVRRGLARSFQVTRLVPALTPRETLTLAILRREGLAGSSLRDAMGHAPARAEAEALLASLGLAPLADLPVREVPYGAQRLLELALALAPRPRVLLLDEPAAGVGAEEVPRILAALRGLPPGIAVLMVEHDLDLVASFASRVIRLDAGRVACDGPPGGALA